MGFFSYFYSDSSTSGESIYPNMPSIDRETLKKVKLQLKKEDKYALNLGFSCSNLATRCDIECQDEYFVVLSLFEKENGIEKCTKVVGRTERVRGENPEFTNQIEVDFSFSKYVKHKADVYHCT